MTDKNNTTTPTKSTTRPTVSDPTSGNITSRVDNGNKKPSVKNFLTGNACILLATIIWGINVSVTKALEPQWMTANGVSAVRIIGGCILFWIASLFVSHNKVAKSDWVKFISAGVVGMFGFIFLFVTSLRYGSPIDISIIMTLPPVFVILIGAIFQHRRPSFLELIGVVVSFAGAVIVILDAGSTSGGSDRLLGDILAVASTVCYALYLVILEGPTKRYRPLTMLRWVFLFAALPALFLLRDFDKMPLFTTTQLIPWLEIGFVLFLSTFFAYFLVEPAIKRIGSELVSLYQYLITVFAAISAVMMGLSHLRWMQVLAMAIIIVGMVVTNIGKRHKKTGSN